MSLAGVFLLSRSRSHISLFHFERCCCLFIRQRFLFFCISFLFAVWHYYYYYFVRFELSLCAHMRSVWHESTKAFSIKKFKGRNKEHHTQTLTFHIIKYISINLWLKITLKDFAFRWVMVMMMNGIKFNEMPLLLAFITIYIYVCYDYFVWLCEFRALFCCSLPSIYFMAWQTESQTNQIKYKWNGMKSNDTDSDRTNIDKMLSL